MTGLFADRLFRIAFALTGIYNLAFGLWAALWPHAFFELFGLAPPRYSGIWACLGMVVGVYGLLYLHAAWKFETAWPIIAVGLLGKVLGPIGMLMSFGEDWPRRIGMLCIYNDLIWWLPFGLFLVRGTKFGHWLVRAAPWICVAIHLIGSLAAILFLRHGTPIQSNEALRASYIAEHSTIWSIGWFLWMLSAMSFVGFCAWWGSYLATPSALNFRAKHDEQNMAQLDLRNVLITLAVVVAALGTVFDFSGEGTLILLLVEKAATAPLAAMSATQWDAAAFVAAERNFTLLSAGVANILYTIAGMILTQLTHNLPRWIRISMWFTWIAGIAMTIAAIFDNVPGLVLTSFALFPPLIVWTAWMGARWRGP